MIGMRKVAGISHSKHGNMLKKWAFCAVSIAVFTVMLLPVSVMAYDRFETTVTSGGSQITVYKGLTNSNDVAPYLATPGNYLAFNRYYTRMKMASTSNITSSTNFVTTSAGSSREDEYICNGGINGVSWNTESKTLTLDNATGTIITIKGPELKVSALNTYNSNLSTLIDITIPNLTYYKQLDVFAMPDGGSSPHSKENSTTQDTVRVNLRGTNNFNNICLSGNIRVIFEGSGTLTLNATQTWNYDDYSEPGFDDRSNPSVHALSSYPTIGYNGDLEGSVTSTSNFGPVVRTLTETYTYALPEIVISENLKIAEGGNICNSSWVGDASYFTFAGKTSPTDSTRLVASIPADAIKTYFLSYQGTKYNMVYNDAETAFYVKITSGMGQDATTKYYDVTADIASWDPWESYIGTPGTPSQKVVINAGPKKGEGHGHSR